MLAASCRRSSMAFTPQYSPDPTNLPKPVSPLLATAVCALTILILFRLDRDRIGANSKVLWIPMAWLMIGGSRNISEWLQMSGPVDSVDRYMEGNPVDRYVLS